VIYGFLPWQTDYDVSLTFRISSAATLSVAVTADTSVLLHIDTPQRRKRRAGNLGETGLDSSDFTHAQ